MSLAALNLGETEQAAKDGGYADPQRVAGWLNSVRLQRQQQKAGFGPLFRFWHLPHVWYALDSPLVRY